MSVHLYDFDVCVPVCMHACMHVCAHVPMYVSIGLCIHIYVYIYVAMRVQSLCGEEKTTPRRSFGPALRASGLAKP